MLARVFLLYTVAATAAASAGHGLRLRQLKPRQDAALDDAPTSTTSTSRSTVTGEPIPYCSSIFETFVTEIPALPTEALDFSEKYYESATRTASETLSDCAWVSAIPESLDEPMIEYFEALVDFFDDPGLAIDQATLSRCDNIDWARTDDAVSICVEFEDYGEALEARRDEVADKADDDSAGERISAAFPFVVIISVIIGSLVW